MSPRSKARQSAFRGYRWVSLPPYMTGGTTFKESKYGALRNHHLWLNWQEAVREAQRIATKQVGDLTAE